MIYDFFPPPSIKTDKKLGHLSNTNGAFKIFQQQFFTKHCSKKFILERIYLDLWCGLLNATSEHIFKDVFDYVEEINGREKGEHHEGTCLEKGFNWKHTRTFKEVSSTRTENKHR